MVDLNGLSTTAKIVASIVTTFVATATIFTLIAIPAMTSGDVELATRLEMLEKAQMENRSDIRVLRESQLRQNTEIAVLRTQLDSILREGK